MIDLIKIDAAQEARETFPHLFAQAFAFAEAQRKWRETHGRKGAV